MLLLILYQNTISKTFCPPPVPHFNHLTTNYVILPRIFVGLVQNFPKLQNLELLPLSFYCQIKDL